MKKLIIIAAIALGTIAQAQEVVVDAKSNGTVVAAAQEGTPQLIATVQPAADTFKEIKVTDVPAAVAALVAKDFKGATISKAFVNKKNEYKLELNTMQDGRALSKTVYANKKGEWIKVAEQQ